MTVLDFRTVKKLAEDAGWKAEPFSTIATQLAWLESRFDTNAHVTDADDDSYGLWQINMKAHTLASLNAISEGKYNLKSVAQLFDAKTNSLVAFALFKDAGNVFSPWSNSVQKLPNANIPQLTDPALQRESPLELLGPLAGPLEAIGRVFQVLLKRDFWVALGKGALGVSLVLFAFIFFTKTGEQAAQTATRIATKGAVKGKSNIQTYSP